jgi:ectoine hydroxylase-related dioxygenase (phytanoyl-CoA dioxygenase family)
MTLLDEEMAFFDENGYLIIQNAAAKEWLDELRKRFERVMLEQGYERGREIQKEINNIADVIYAQFNHSGSHHESKVINEVWNLVNEGDVFDGVYTHEKVLAPVKHILGNEMKVSHVTAREVLPSGGVPELETGPESNSDSLVNCLLILDDYNEQNGALTVIPGSHKHNGSGELPLYASAGSVVLLNGKLKRKEPVNNSERNKRMICTDYVQRNQPQHLDQSEYVLMKTYNRISDTAKYLLDV